MTRFRAIVCSHAASEPVAGSKSSARFQRFSIAMIFDGSRATDRNGNINHSTALIKLGFTRTPCERKRSVTEYSRVWRRNYASYSSCAAAALG